MPVRGPASRSCLVRGSDTGSSDHCVQPRGASGEPRRRAVLTGLSGTHFSRESPTSQETSVALRLMGQGAEKGDPEERSRLTRTAAGGCGESAGRCLSDRREGAVPRAAGSPVWRGEPTLSGTILCSHQPRLPPRNNPPPLRGPTNPVRTSNISRHFLLLTPLFVVFTNFPVTSGCYLIPRLGRTRED